MILYENLSQLLDEGAVRHGPDVDETDELEQDSAADEALTDDADASSMGLNQR